MTLSLVGSKIKSARLLFKINTKDLFHKFLNATYDLQSFFPQHKGNEFLWVQLKWWNSGYQIKETKFWGSDTGPAEHSSLSARVVPVFPFVLKDRSAFNFNFMRSKKNSLGLRYLEKTALFGTPLQTSVTACPEAQYHILEALNMQIKKVWN